MSGTGWAWLKLLEITGTVGNWGKWLEMADYGQKWLEIA